MRRLMLAAGSGAVLIGLVVPALAAETTVELGSQRFTPKTLTIAVGDTVKWHSNDSFHDVKFTDRPAMPPQPSSMADFNAADVQRTFTEPGTYRYYCEVHSSGADDPAGMTGTIVVGDGGTPTPTPSPTPEPVALPFTASVKGLRLIVRSSQRVKVQAVVKRGRRHLDLFTFRTRDGRKVLRLRRKLHGELPAGRYRLALRTDGYPGTARLTFRIPARAA